MNVLEKLISKYAEPPMKAVFNPEGEAMEVSIRKITMRDQEEIEAKLNKEFPDKADTEKRNKMFGVEIFRYSLLDEDGTRAIKSDKDLQKFKDALGVKVATELIVFVTGKSMGFDETPAGDEKKD